jgi:predicted phosphodiesterase
MTRVTWTSGAMRLAVLSDIHGNVWALEAAIRDAQKQGADLIVNAGDSLSGPLEPAATADVLIGLDLPTVSGNQDRQLLECAHAPGGPSDQFAFEHTTERHRAWLASLPESLEIGEMYMCHGAPRSDTTYLLEEIEGGTIRPRSADAVEQLTAGITQRLIVCGHSHRTRTCAIAGGRLVVNAGSVGLQAYRDDGPTPHFVENMSPDLHYALCDQMPDGAWTVMFRRLGYDHAKAAATARRNRREDWATYLESGRCS